MLLIVILFNGFVVKIPVIALASVMVVVAISTFNWNSLKRIAKVPKSDTLVMVSTVIVVLLTDNLAFGVITGFLISAISFASKISEIEVNKSEVHGYIKYEVVGQLFFASTTKFLSSFDYNENIKEIDIDFTNARLWDESSVDAVDKVVLKYRKNNIKINLIGLSKSCEKLIDDMAIHNKIDNIILNSGH